MSRAIFWFRNDLRTEDNQALLQATADNVEVLPVYVLDNSWLKGKQWNIDRIGPFRLKFLLESLKDLKSQLNKLGSDLRILTGQSVEELLKVADEFDCSTIYAQAACAHDEVKTEQLLVKYMDCQFIWGETLYHPDDFDFTIDKTPSVFTQFRKAVEKKSTIRDCDNEPINISSPQNFGTPIPDINSFGFKQSKPDNRGVLTFKGGSTAALERLNYYLWDRELLSTYKKTRNNLIGSDYSSKFSPWLTFGCLSPRQIYWQVKKYEKYVKKNSSTYWLVFELLWRDYFHFIASKSGELLFRKSGITGEGKVESNSNKLFQVWADGRTKQPFIDANMCELNTTGFMSNRGRQIVASYLIYTLKVDWRLGAAYFEKMLIDYDACNNYGNWAYIAGVGNDPKGGRIFDVTKQKEMYDPKGTYSHLWSTQ